MKTTKPTKAFDAIDIVRAIRANITRETEHMSFPELQRYMKQKLQASGLHPTPPTTYPRHAEQTPARLQQSSSSSKWPWPTATASPS